MAFELRIGSPLPADYRDFLGRCNGGYLGGALVFRGPTPAGEDASASIHHIGGLRPESYYSLIRHFETFGKWLPTTMIWIMDDPGGNALCLGIHDTDRDKIFFWDHERGDVTLLVSSFSEFVDRIA